LTGYTVYIEQIQGLVEKKQIVKKKMGEEIERCQIAIEMASKGHIVGIVCSGDGGLYGMAGLILELIEKETKKPEVEIIPGVTAALSASALLGAPIVEDFCTISLSDYMTPWDKILTRIEYASKGDFTIALYNPRSNARPDHLQKAIDVILMYRSGDVPVGIVRNAYRSNQEIIRTTLEKLPIEQVDMFCTVIIGNSKTRWTGDFMVTSRGYRI
jgi:precorrin-3B C17-methyltransferase